MKPVEFPEQTTVFAKDQPQYLPLPAHHDPHFGVVTSCWALTWRERVSILFGGRLWLQQMTLNYPLQPQKPTTKKPVFL